MIKIIKLPDPHTATVIIASGDELDGVIHAIHSYVVAYVSSEEKTPNSKKIWDVLVEAGYESVPNINWAKF